MTVLILTNNAVGLYKIRAELIAELVKRYEVIVSAPRDDFSDRIAALGAVVADTEFNRRGKNPFRDLQLLETYRRLIRRIRPDVVLTYTIKPNVYGGIACRLTKTPYLANVTGLGTAVENGGLLTRLAVSLYRSGLKKANCVFFQNDANRKFFEDKKLVCGRTRRIPGSGVNLEKHCPESYPDDADGIRFLFIGRIMRDKGIGELLEAMKLLRERHPVTLDLVGGYDEDYSAQIGEAEAAGFVRYHGQQPSVHRFIQNAHCTVLPSYHEGMANVLLESASTARPVIATTVPGCRETFEEGVSGFGCKAGSAESLAEAMERFLALTQEERRKMGEAGRRKVEAEFDRNLVIRAYLEEIDKIV